MTDSVDIDIAVDFESDVYDLIKADNAAAIVALPYLPA